jgi:acyl-coenzyme A synthetase/AMP-(fatty) acid ligase
MKGYWEKPEETAKHLKPGRLPGEQVLHTGDYGRLDEEGYLTFLGRMDDVIKCGGEKVAPKEVEAALAEVPGIQEAAVIGVPDGTLGHAVKAFVVLEPGAVLTEKAVRLECQKRLEPFMVPKQVVFVIGLPRTESGKIWKAGLE